MTDATILFRDALQAVYGPLDWLPEPDGAIHRFRVPEDKPGSLNGWYVLYLDGIASGAFGSWKAGGASTWCSREPVDAREAAQIRERVDQARRQREAEQHRRQQQAAEKATATPFTSGMMMMGASLALGGVIQMLSPQAGGLKTSAAPENVPGYAFGSAKNTTASGNPVPLCCGNRRWGGAIISAAIYAEDQV